MSILRKDHVAMSNLGVYPIRQHRSPQKASLHEIAPATDWKPISLGELIDPNAVKKGYRKALLAVHPDKRDPADIEAKVSNRIAPVSSLRLLQQLTFATRLAFVATCTLLPFTTNQVLAQLVFDALRDSWNAFQASLPK